MTSFKMFTGDTFPVEYGLINLVVEKLGELGGVGVFHGSRRLRPTPERIKNEEKTAPKYFAEARPENAEAMAAHTVLCSAQAHDAKYFGIHTTSRAATTVIDGFRDDGLKVRAETCTHYTVYEKSEFDRRDDLVYDDGEILVDPGYGEFVACEVPNWSAKAEE